MRVTSAVTIYDIPDATPVVPPLNYLSYHHDSVQASEDSDMRPPVIDELPTSLFASWQLPWSMYISSSLSSNDQMQHVQIQKTHLSKLLKDTIQGGDL